MEMLQNEDDYEFCWSDEDDLTSCKCYVYCVLGDKYKPDDSYSKMIFTKDFMAWKANSKICFVKLQDIENNQSKQFFEKLQDSDCGVTEV